MFSESQDAVETRHNESFVTELEIIRLKNIVSNEAERSSINSYEKKHQHKITGSDLNCNENLVGQSSQPAQTQKV
jgi:hypothetical protein